MANDMPAKQSWEVVSDFLLAVKSDPEVASRMVDDSKVNLGYLRKLAETCGHGEPMIAPPIGGLTDEGSHVAVEWECSTAPGEKVSGTSGFVVNGGRILRFFTMSPFPQISLLTGGDATIPAGDSHNG